MTETTETTEATDHSVSASVETKNARWGIIAIAVVAIVFVTILALGMFNSRVDRPDDVAPDFEMKFFNGYEWQGMPVANLSDFQGRPVVLNFWASWCVECIREAKLLEDLWQEYSDQGVVFLGIAYIDVEKNSLAYLEEYGISYPNAPDLRTVISSKYDITGVPETFFIDKNGDVEYIHLSAVTEPMVRSLLDKMLAAEGPAVS
ncbi:MAG: TlpA disulfide reductase family protein [Candidatus Promineifilaceae bacterium]